MHIRINAYIYIYICICNQSSNKKNYYIRILGRIRRDRVRTSKIGRPCALENRITWNKKNNCHKNREKDSRLIKLEWDLIPKTKYNPGRSPERWTDSLITTSTEIHTWKKTCHSLYKRRRRPTKNDRHFVII